MGGDFINASHSCVRINCNGLHDMSKNIFFAFAVLAYFSFGGVKQIGSSREDYLFCIPPKTLGSGYYNLPPFAWEANVLWGSLQTDSKGNPKLGCLNKQDGAYWFEGGQSYAPFKISGEAFKGVLPRHENLAWVGECLAERLACVRIGGLESPSYPTEPPIYLTQTNTFSSLYNYLDSIKENYITSGLSAEDITHLEFYEVDGSESDEIIESLGANINPPELFSYAANPVYAGKIVKTSDLDNLVECINSMSEGCILAKIVLAYHGFYTLNQVGANSWGNHRTRATPKPHWYVENAKPFSLTTNTSYTYDEDYTLNLDSELYYEKVEASFQMGWGWTPAGIDGESEGWTKDCYGKGVEVQYSTTKRMRACGSDPDITGGSFWAAYTNKTGKAERIQNANMFVGVRVVCQYREMKASQTEFHDTVDKDVVVFIPYSITPDNSQPYEGQIGWSGISDSSNELVQKAIAYVWETFGIPPIGELYSEFGAEYLTDTNPPQDYHGSGYSQFHSQGMREGTVSASVYGIYSTVDIKFTTGGDDTNVSN